MRSVVFALLFLASASARAQQATGDDAVAIQLLDHMSTVIGQLKSCRFELQVARDIEEPDLGLVKHFTDDEVLMMQDKMRVKSVGDQGRKGFWYDGKTVTYYSYDENNYATVKAPDTTIETIDAMHDHYGIDFPAADFFYPSFTDDLIDNTDRIAMLGRATVAGVECFHILGTAPGMNVQLWIADDLLNLPVKMVVADHTKPHAPQYEATFSNWQINTEMPEAIFAFVPPKSASMIKLVPKK